MRAQVNRRNMAVRLGVRLSLRSYDYSFLPVSVVARLVRVPGGGLDSLNVPSSRPGARRQGCGAVTQGARGPRRWGLKRDSRGGRGHRDAPGPPHIGRPRPSQPRVRNAVAMAPSGSGLAGPTQV